MLVLASASPRRRELLRQWGYEFELVNAPVSEDLAEDLSPEEAVQALARRKALTGYKVWNDKGGSPQDLVLAADTIVVLGEKILGKPSDEEDAYTMLKALSGQTHQVMTGIALATEIENKVQIESAVDVTTVTFRKINEQEIREYIASGEPMDKAAAYAIQGEGGKFVSGLQGSATNVIGLPMELLVARLEQKGVFPV
ncbi:MAG: septum formation inhibitor Maf [Peptococcaceae bacterium]|nr:septum formation inhibitor Maf [Peptococcaceae bacterium]